MTTPNYLPLFDGNHYGSWSVQMKTCLKASGLWDVVESGTTVHQEQEPEPPLHQEQEPEPPHHDHESEWDVVDNVDSSSRTDQQQTYFLMDNRSYYDSYYKQCMEMNNAAALQMIQSAVTYDIFKWIAFATSAKEAWELLKARSQFGPMFQSSRLAYLKKKYEGLPEMKDSETILEFTGKVMELVYRMKSCGWEVEDNEVVKKIVSCLHPSFKKVLSVCFAETLSISGLIDCLLVHEYDMRRLSSLNDEPVVVVNKSREEEEEVEVINRLREEVLSLTKKIQAMQMQLEMDNQAMHMQLQMQNRIMELMQQQGQQQNKQDQEDKMRDLLRSEHLFY